ncbi:hypothetical protein Q9L58_007615 [Maublancomyces gigas]|uniref:Uncharacterized protein n=1 Tax=Discina gigas TaxID=1032678 RepID=A0ABR3GC21_9PEZI
MAIKSKGQIPARRRPRRQPRPVAISKASSAPSPPLPESDLDTFFESGPFSALCQGATGAEIAEDFKLLRVEIEEMANILLNSSSATTYKPSTLRTGASGNWEAPVTASTPLTPGAGTRRPSRTKVQKPPTESTEPLTPQSLNEDAFMGGSASIPVHDMKKYTSVVPPISFYNKLEVEPAQLRAKRRRLSEDGNRTTPDRAEKPRSILLH